MRYLEKPNISLTNFIFKENLQNVISRDEQMYIRFEVFVCSFRLFWAYRPTRKFFTHMETSPLPVKGCKFLPMLGTHGHWAVTVLMRATPTVTRGIRSPRTRDTRNYCRALSNEAVTTCFYDLDLLRLGLEHLTTRLRGQRSNPLHHLRSLNHFQQILSKCSKPMLRWYLYYSFR